MMGDIDSCAGIAGSAFWLCEDTRDMTAANTQKPTTALNTKKRRMGISFFSAFLDGPLIHLSDRINKCRESIALSRSHKQRIHHRKRPRVLAPQYASDTKRR